MYILIKCAICMKKTFYNEYLLIKNISDKLLRLYKFYNIKRLLKLLSWKGEKDRENIINYTITVIVLFFNKLI